MPAGCDKSHPVFNSGIMTTLMNFWIKLKTLRQAQGKAITILAPMANVTDFAFRQIVAQCGRPDVFYTEFLSCDGIVSKPEKFKGELYFEKLESPIVVQFFGAKPENFYKCAKLARELGYDGIDINMGCPDRSVEKQGAGAALIKNPKLAQEIIKSTMEGARSTSSGQAGLPVSIKTRLGYNKIEIEDWIPCIAETKPAALIIHGRTRKEMSKVDVHWDAISRSREIIKSINPETLVIGNRDVKDLESGYQKSEEYKLDGIMIGRGIFENPWFFNVQSSVLHTPKERIGLMLEHINNFEKLWGRNKNFDVLKRFFKIYISEWPGAKELRTQLMATKNGREVKDIVDSYLKNSVLY